MKKEAFTGVSNPYAIAEIVAGRRIRWDSLDNRDKVLESILHIPEKDIFDINKNPLLNPMIKIDSKGSVKKLDLRIAKKIMLKKLDKVLITPTVSNRFSTLKTKTVKNRLNSLLKDQLLISSTNNIPWNPTDKEWIDKGDYYEDLGEFNDPIQGALGDCYYIAALSSVSWARPYAIVNMVRASSLGNDSSPIHRVELYKDGKGTSHKIEVSEKVPVSKNSHNWIYARSLDAGETWPAIMEKAYAKWKTKNTTDQPPYAPIAGGDPVRSCAEIISGTRHYIWNSTKTGNELWSYVRQNSLSRRTINPMVAWTYGSSPSGLDYHSANVVGNHAYSVLGWNYKNGTKYIVLRNPWGTKHATLDTQVGHWYAYETSYWARIPLNQNGVFSMKATTFKKYFAGIGHVQ